MEDFLFHKLSAEDKEKVKKDAKKILDSFSDRISKVKVLDEEPVVKKKDYEREEKDGEECYNNFREIMFENAPDKSGDFIIAEKKSWI